MSKALVEADSLKGHEKQLFFEIPINQGYSEFKKSVLKKERPGHNFALGINLCDYSFNNNALKKVRWMESFSCINDTIFMVDELCFDDATNLLETVIGAYRATFGKPYYETKELAIWIKSPIVIQASLEKKSQTPNVRISHIDSRFELKVIKNPSKYKFEYGSPVNNYNTLDYLGPNRSKVDSSLILK